jgi:hypothetical protein
MSESAKEREYEELRTVSISFFARTVSYYCSEPIRLELIAQWEICSLARRPAARSSFVINYKINSEFSPKVCFVFILEQWT